MNLTEHQSYNSIATALDGDYAKISKLTANFDTFAKGWESIKGNHSNIDMVELWKVMTSLEIELILKDDAEFPLNLKEIPYPPLAIYIKGNRDALNKKFIAIVGTRRATPLGKNAAKKIAGELAKEEFAISSGLALGIDAAAHAGALEERGINIAVLACGLDKIYPAMHQNLAEDIIKTGGAIISEYPLHSPAYAARFIERNRIISGLSMGTLVIEAPKKSGALATARFALEQNRNVYVVPGPINSLNYVGSHGLIKAGAMLITETADILKDLNIEPKQLSLNIQKVMPQLTAEESVIFNVIKNAGEVVTVDKIIELSNYEPYTVNRNLTFLLLKDIIRESGGGFEIS